MAADALGVHLLNIIETSTGCLVALAIFTVGRKLIAAAAYRAIEALMRQRRRLR